MRVFISSPNDVAIERAVARRVIERLDADLGSRADVKPVVWELEPLLATSTPQDQITLPSECEIAVFIFWSRMGTMLPAFVCRADGTRYNSGTEYEYEDALRGFNKTGSPQILVYWKTLASDPPGADLSHVKEFIHQREMLEQFKQKHLVNVADQTFKGMAHPFTTPEEFEEIVESHLTKLINTLVDRKFPQSAKQTSTQSRQWSGGNPFQGLQCFQIDNAPVYFGRTNAISQCLEKLKRQETSGYASLFIVGMSGTGKSSLAYAGILPMLRSEGSAYGIEGFRWATMRPSDQDGNLFEGLLAALQTDHALPELGEPDKAHLLASYNETPEWYENCLLSLLTQDPDTTPLKLIIIIDQFEEIITHPAIDEQLRERFVAVIDQLTLSGHVWLITTLRSDFYGAIGNDKALAQWRLKAAQYDLLPPSESELGQMIRMPARIAGVRFDLHPDTAEPLDEAIHHAINKNPESLPLLEYALTELYERRTPDGFLTYEAYEDAGGLEGAIASCVKRAIAQAGDSSHQRIVEVFKALVDFDDQLEGHAIRRWVSLDQIVNSETRSIIDRFIEARLLVVRLGSDGRPEMTVAHESLFQHWPELRQWLDLNRENLLIRARLAVAAKNWKSEGRPVDRLLSVGKPVEEGIQLIGSNLTVSATTSAFVEDSARRVRRNRFLRNALNTGLVLLVIATGVLAYQANRASEDADHRRAQSEDLISFLLGDLHENLTAIGRLEILSSAVDTAMEYFSSLDDKDLSNEMLSRRSRMFYQLGDVSFQAGEFEKASTAFVKSLQEAEQLARMQPDDLSIRYELAQANYWVGFSNWYQGDLSAVAPFFNRYREIAQSLVDAEPGNEDWLLELGSSYSNLGTFESSRQRLHEAETHFANGARVLQKLVEANPKSHQYRSALAEVQSWTGSVQRKTGNATGAVFTYGEVLDIHSSLVAEIPSNLNWQYSAAQAHRHLADALHDSNEPQMAYEHNLEAVSLARNLVAQDPQNVRFRYGQALFQLNLALATAQMGNPEDADTMLSHGAQLVGQLVEQSDNPRLRILAVRYQLAQADNWTGARTKSELLQAVEQAIKQMEGIPATLDEYDLVMARALLIAAELQQSSDKALRALELLEPLSTEWRRPDYLAALVKARNLTSLNSGVGDISSLPAKENRG
jgi:tetratricopeptide (TPR) repeat protein